MQSLYELFKPWGYGLKNFFFRLRTIDASPNIVRNIVTLQDRAIPRT